MKKSIFITGGSSGIGLATALKFKSAGFVVGICARNTEQLEKLQKEHGFEVYSLDVTKSEDVKKAVYTFYQKHGLNIVFANAGKSYVHKNKIPDFKVARAVIDINLNGVVNVFEPACEIFLRQGFGQLVATSSVAGLNGLPGVSGYSAAKSGVIKFCESLAIDLKSEGIAVTCICPGFVDTPLTQLNPHPMPFMISAEVAAEKIYKGIMAQKHIVFFPFFFSMMVRLLSVLPRNLYAFIMGIKIFNYSKQK